MKRYICRDGTCKVESVGTPASLPSMHIYHLRCATYLEHDTYLPKEIIYLVT